MLQHYVFYGAGNSMSENVRDREISNEESTRPLLVDEEEGEIAK